MGTVRVHPLNSSLIQGFMRNVQSIANQSFDVIVIGGGINGAATARDAALRGLKTIFGGKRRFCQRYHQLVNPPGSRWVAVI